MMNTVKVALVGDRNESVRAHGAIPKALSLAARVVGANVREEWLPTPTLEVETLKSYDAVWVVPGSPYADMNRVLAAIRHARETGMPFLGTCGGFQHAIIEIARDVAGIHGADHEESSPAASELVVHRLACELLKVERKVHFATGSRLAAIYEQNSAVEGYQCSFGVNPRYRAALESAGVRFTAFDDDGDVRAMELASHPFFVATLFQFELASLRDETPKAAVAFVRAALAR